PGLANLVSVGDPCHRPPAIIFELAVHMPGESFETKALHQIDAEIGGEVEAFIAILLRIAVALLGLGDAFRGDAAGRQPVIVALVAAAQGEPPAQGLIRTSLDKTIETQAIAAAPGDHIDHAADGVAAIEGALRTLEDLDPRNVMRVNSGKVKGAA